MSSFSSVNPSIEKDYEDDGVLHFILKDIHLSIANAIRRTILMDIPVVVIRTENTEINQCSIVSNTTRFHNEIVKQRLSCIPIITSDLDNFPGKYKLYVKVQNGTDHELRWVTTDDFVLKDKQNDQIVDKLETQKIFPHDQKTNRPIDFLRLRPSIGPTIRGEEINLSAEFSVATAKENGMFNAVSKCAFHNVIDAEARENLWAAYLQTYKDEGRTEEEIEFEKKNFNYLDAYRCYKVNKDGEPNEFEFIVKTIGHYTNYQIVNMACEILSKKLQSFGNQVKSQVVPIHESIHSRDLGYTSVTVSSIANSYDVILEEEDYTLGLMLEHFLFKMFYHEEEELVFIGFKKYHPHDDYSVIRLAFKNASSASLLAKQYLIQAANEAQRVLDIVRMKFHKGK
jgi:DNA-directed RNA polymerase II subunit RPB3